MTKSDIMGIQVVNNVAESMLLEKLSGDSLRLQVLADFLSLSVSCTPTGGLLIIAAKLTKDVLAKSVQLVNLELRITHTGGGVPEELLSQMYGNSVDATEEGISLVISRNLLMKLMSGDVRYLREATKSTFIISVELSYAGTKKASTD